jgi:prevent-host-death family protein
VSPGVTKGLARAVLARLARDASGHLDGAVGRHRHQERHTCPMPRKVSLAEARDHLTGLVRDVERGGRVDLTRRGKRVAVLLSVDEYDRLRKPRADARGMLQALTAWRSGLPEDFAGISAAEVRAWRDPSPGRDVGAAHGV